MTALLAADTSSTLLDLSLANTLTSAEEGLQHHALPPAGHSPRYQATLDEIATLARQLRLSSYIDVICNADRLIRDLTGIADLGAIQSRPDADRLHHVRNTLSALLGAAALSRGEDPTRGMRQLPALQPRTRDRGRTLENDETLLARIVATWGLGDPKRIKASAVYAMADAGAYASETTCVAAPQIDNIAHPTVFKVPGVANRALPRTLALDPWGSAIIAEVLSVQLLLPGGFDRPLGYDGRYPGGSAKASASANGCITRILDAAGLNLSDLNASSPALGAANRANRQTGLAAAAKVLGREIAGSGENVHRLLKISQKVEIKDTPHVGGFGVAG